MTGETRFFWRPAFLFLFFCISGICTAFSHSNLIRGARLFSVSALVSIVTYFVQDKFGFECFILFGVLHCLALITLAYALFDIAYTFIFKMIEKKKPVPPALKRWLKVVVLTKCDLADADWRGVFFYENSWWTADYFPLFPYIAIFFFGASLSEVLYAKRKSLFPSLDGCWHYFFSVPGRLSLWVYLGGQLVALGVFYALDAVLLG